MKDISFSKTLAITGLAGTLLVAGAGSTLAKFGENKNFNRPVLTEEQKNQLKEVAGDREKVQALLEEFGIQRRPFTMRKENRGQMPGNRPQLSDEQKETLREAHQSGDQEAVKKLLEEYGIQRGVRMHHKNSERQGSEKHKGTKYEKHEARKAAVESRDYEAFLESLPEDHQEVSESDFEKIQEMHKAMKSGDHETAKKIRKELGFKMPHHKMHREDKNFERGNRPELSDEQKETLREAHQSGDQEAVKKLLEEYGIQRGVRMKKGMYGNQ